MSRLSSYTDKEYVNERYGIAPYLKALFQAMKTKPKSVTYYPEQPPATVTYYPEAVELEATVKYAGGYGVFVREN